MTRALGTGRACNVIPLTFVAGVYGMNFKYMPELEQSWGYPAVLALMALMAGGMLLYFRHEGWLGAGSDYDDDDDVPPSPTRSSSPNG